MIDVRKKERMVKKGGVFTVLERGKYYSGKKGGGKMFFFCWKIYYIFSPDYSTESFGKN